jgi:hypothetical protein
LIDSVSITVPKLLNVDVDPILEELRGVCLGTYNVLGEVIRHRIQLITTEFSEQLYLTFRSYCTKESVKRDFWFAAISDNYGFRLAENRIGSELIVGIPNAFRRSKSSLSAEIIDTALPIQGLLMRNVFNTSDPIDVDIGDSDYGKSKSTYAEAMCALYGGTAFTIFPIYVRDGWAVLGLSSIQNRAEVYKILSDKREEFVSICENSKNRAKNALTRVKRRMPTMPLAEFGGKFFGNASAEFIKAMSGI